VYSFEGITLGINIILKEFKNLNEKEDKLVRSSIHAVNGRQTVMQKDIRKRCTNIEILWYRKLVSLASPEFREILLQRSLRRWRADALNMPKVSTAIG